MKPLPILRFTTVRINASKLRYPATVRNNREESESRRTVRETILLSSRITIGSTTFPNYSPRNTFETTRSREQTERGIAMGQLDFTDFGGKFHFSPTLKSSIQRKNFHEQVWTDPTGGRADNNSTFNYDSVIGSPAMRWSRDRKLYAVWIVAGIVGIVLSHPIRR